MWHNILCGTTKETVDYDVKDTVRISLCSFYSKIENELSIWNIKIGTSSRMDLCNERKKSEHLVTDRQREKMPKGYSQLFYRGRSPCQGFLPTNKY